MIKRDSQKLKVAFHQFHPIGLLEEWSKCKVLALVLLFSVAMVTKMATKLQGFQLFPFLEVGVHHEIMTLRVRNLDILINQSWNLISLSLLI